MINFFKNYINFNELITLSIIKVVHKIMDFSDTEFHKVKQTTFQPSLRQLTIKWIVLLTNVTDLLKFSIQFQSHQNERNGTLVAGVAHEIKNPLVAVKTFTQLISKDWETATFEQNVNKLFCLNCIELTNYQNFNYFGKNEISNLNPLIYQV